MYRHLFGDTIHELEDHVKARRLDNALEDTSDGSRFTKALRDLDPVAGAGGGRPDLRRGPPELLHQDDVPEHRWLRRHGSSDGSHQFRARLETAQRPSGGAPPDFPKTGSISTPPTPSGRRAFRHFT